MLFLLGCVHRVELRSQTDVVEARALGREVRLTLAPEAARRMRDQTARHVGDRISLVVDGAEASRLRVRDAIADGEVKLTVDSPDEAEALARKLMHR
jgi:preprotein translocase subunit SecD